MSVLEAVVDAAVARGEDVRLSTDNAGCVPLIGGTYQWGAEMAEKPLLQQRLPSAPAAAAYGEQCADTDGLAAVAPQMGATYIVCPNCSKEVPVGAYERAIGRAHCAGCHDEVRVMPTALCYMVADGHEHPQAAMERMLTGSDAADPFPQFLQLHATIDKLEARIARKEAANEALVAKLEATLADMQSLQRKAADWGAECRRLSALLIEAQQQLGQRMAMPANALKHTKGLR